MTSYLDILLRASKQETLASEKTTTSEVESIPIIVSSSFKQQPKSVSSTTPSATDKEIPEEEGKGATEEATSTEKPKTTKNDERLRGIEKRMRQRDFDDSKMKPWSERWTAEHRGKRVGSCTRRCEHGNSQSNSYCCRGFFANRQWKVHEGKNIAREAEKAIVKK
jgi:hypothetical protein